MVRRTRLGSQSPTKSLKTYLSRGPPMSTIAKMHLGNIGSPNFTFIGLIIVRLNAIVLATQWRVLEDSSTSIAVPSKTCGCLIGQVEWCGISSALVVVVDAEGIVVLFRWRTTGPYLLAISTQRAVMMISIAVHWKFHDFVFFWLRGFVEVLLFDRFNASIHTDLALVALFLSFSLSLSTSLSLYLYLSANFNCYSQ
jgi:hypothetical protein